MEVKPVFQGIFNDYFRKTLHDFRVSRGLTYQELAYRLNCHWSTICKWETGKSRRCAGIMFSLLKSLFEGEFDNWQDIDEGKYLERMRKSLNDSSSRREMRVHSRFMRSNMSFYVPEVTDRPKALPFSGIITHEHIQRLRWLQSVSRMSDYDFSQVIECSPLTLSNWKSGRRATCQTRFIIPLRLLFRGELDDKLIAFQKYAHRR